MAKGLNFNFNFNYDVNLDKLYNDAKTSDKAQITSTQNDVTARYDGGTTNTYGGYSNNQTETMDLSSSVSNETNPATNNGSSNTNFSNNISTNNNTQSINMNNNSKASTSLERSNNSSFNSSLNNNSQNTNGVSLTSNNQSMNSGTNNITSNNSINSSTNNLNPNTSSNLNSTNQNTINQFSSNQNIETDNKSTTGQASYNNSANIDTNSSTSKINTSSTETPSNNASTNVNINSSTSSSTNKSINNKEVSVDANSNSMNKSSNSMSINNDEVIFTTIDNKGQEIVTKIAVEDYINTLQSYGLRIEDINKILNGEITPEALLEEIQNDSDTSRKEEMMASSYLQAYGLDFTNMKDLELAINEKTKELAKLQQEKREIDNHEIDSIMNIVTRLKMGEDLDNILKTPVAWQYTDENGNVSYRYDNPYENGYDPTMNQNAYTPLTFEEMYKDSKLLEELKSVLSQETIKPFFFGEEKTIYRWNETSEQSAYFDKIVTNYNNTTTERKDNLKELNSKIKELQSQLSNYQYVYDYINNEIAYYMKNVDSYTSKDDFILKSDFNSKCLDRINEIKKQYEGIQNFNYTAEMPVIYINDKSQLVDVLSCMINEEGNVANGYLNIGTTIVQLSSTDEMLGHYEKWISFMSADEKSVFNYIYNTEGTNAAYDYLKKISDELDNRWLANKTQEDQEFASEHPVLASVASIVVTPIEGISAACYSMNSLLRNEKIRRTDVYSAGDVWRGQVAQDIAEYSPTLSFVYSTGMSMADSVSLIAISAATGGTATPVISAALMGSRAYVSTLNDALDRGLSDGTAVALAWSSAVVETAMESYSVGHLLNLETKLGESTSKLVDKIADSIPKKELANIVTQTTYVAANAISQGIAEGEEEFATEILNYMFDTFLCNINEEGNKSNYAISINNYINMGYTEEEAFQLTMSDFGNQAFQAFLGGFASGICFGSFAGVKTSYKVSKQMSQNMINDYEGRGASLKNMIANFKAGIDAMNSIDAKTFAQGIEVNRVQQEMMEQEYKEQQAQQYKEIIENITKPLTSLANQSTAITLLDIKKATLGTILCIPAFFNKFRSATLTSNQQLITKISNEGLLHLTTEEAANKIIESGYIKASKDPIVSYGKSKSFFFAGIPSFGNVCLNLNTFREKAVAVRIKPSTEILNNKEFNYRAYDDFAIMHSGNLDFEQGTAEIVYLGLTVNDAGEFEYKEITKEEYDNYTPNTESISRNAPKAIKKLADTIKGALYGLAYQYDVFVNKDYSIADNHDKIGQQQNKAVIEEKIETSSQQSVSDSNSVDNLTSEINSKIFDLESEKLMKSESITNPQIAKFIGYINDYKEQIKNFTGQTDEELSYLDDFRAKVISYGSIEQIIENLDSFDNWEMQRLLNIENPIVVELFNSQKVINYVTENMSKKEIINYSAVIPSHPIIESTFLSLTNKEVEEIGISTILNEFKNFSLDTQKKFVDYHEEFFVKKLNSIFSENLSKDAFMIIFNKVGSFEFLQSNQWNISNLSSEIQNELYNKYKEILYTGTQKQFTQFVTQINDPDYQTQFIKNSPFYSEMINSTDFENIFTNIKDKNFALEIYSNPDAKNKILASGACFKKLLSFLTVEEQSNYLSIAKDKIIEVANSKIYNAVNIISLYITAFDDNNQIALLNDQQIIKSMDSKTIIRLTKMFDGFYNQEILKWSSDTMDADKAQMLFIPEIYEKMDQDAINKAAVALPVYDYDRLIQLNNNGAINAVLDSLISQNFRKFKSNSGFQHLDNFINLYNVLDEEGKQKIKDNISSSMLVSVLAYKEEESLSECLIQKLVNDTEYFDTLTLGGLRKISLFSTDLYGKIYKYLRPQFKLVTFNLENIISLNIQEELIEIFKNKPNLVNYLNVENCSIADFLSLLSANDDIELLYDNLNVETIISLLGESSKTESYLAKLHTLDFERLKKCIVNNIANLELKIKRTPVGISISDYVQISRVLKMFNYQEQVEILDAMKKSDKYLMLFLDLNLDQDVQFKILNDMMFDPELRNSILDDNMELFTNFFDKLNVSTIEYVMNNMNNNFLGFVMSITKRNDLNVKFNEIIKNNPLILSEFNYVDAEMVYSNLSKENADIIDKYVAKYLKEIQNNNLDTLLSDASIAQKSFFIKAFNQNLISNEKLQLLMNIKSKNKFVLSTFNYSLFDDTIYKFGDELLTKLSKYYDVVDQIVELKKTPEKFDLFTQFVINDTTSSSPIVADQKMAMLLNYLLENDVSSELLSANSQEELETARNIILKEIDQFSILDSFEKELVRDRSIITPDNFTLQDYNLKLAEKCDDMLKNATSASEVQNLIFNKYFSISIEDATELFRMYGSRFASIKNLDTDGIATTYLENMKNILNMSMEEAIDYYNSFDTINRYSMNDTLNILNSIKKIYTKSLKSTLFNPTDITGYVEYEGKQIPIYQPKGDFQMLIQSTYTNYGGMPMINDNYFDSWNLSSRTANHGICCSLISNNNMGMAMVRGPGVVIGFNNFSDEQMNMMAPYDIYTRNDGYVIKCQRPLLYLPGQDVMNETRHTHNEFNLERTNLTGEGELANIQPDYVVVFEEMSEEQKQNAYKASVEFAVPLVYINKTSLAASESAKIDNLISEYKSSGNIELLKEILVLHENNRSGYRNPTDSSLVTQYFSPDRIISVLNEAIESITIEKDLQYIKEFLEDEIRKFDTTLEATHRANEIDIDVKDLITKIDNKISALADIEATKDMIIQLHDEDPEITAKIISIGKLLEIIKNNELFEELQTYEEYKAPDRKLVSNFTRVEYLEAYMQLYNAIKKNNYNLGLTDEQNLRLESLYIEAINTLEISKIQYNEFLPDEVKLKVMFNNNTIYNYSDLNILYNYYFEHFKPEILRSNPTLIYSPEFKFYLNILGDYVFSNTSQLSNSDLNFWNSLVTLKKDFENIIIEDKIDVGEQEFQNLISNIHNWHQNEREYVDYFTNYYDVDVSNLIYDSELPDSLKIKIMIRDNKVYDRNLAINEFNKIITKESITDYNLIFNDLFMFYFNNISPTLTTEEANKTYDYNTLKKIYLNILNKIVKQNIDISEENFKKLLNMIYPNQTIVLNYISNYLDNHKEIDSTYVLAPIIDKIQYSDNLPENLKNEILHKILSEYDWFILQNSSNVYGSDQNAVFKYITIDGNYFDWLTDENDFINYLTTKREYDQDTAKKKLQSLKETNGWFKINQATNANIVIEYIFDKCARENRFDVLDIFEKSFTFQYNSEIERLGNKLMDQGMSYVEALRTLCAIDSTGCCSYAAVVNSILLSYKNNPQAFENDFGYPMYVYIDGKQEFNAAELLLDMYIYLNSNKYVGNQFKVNMFTYDQTGALHIKELTTNDQVYLSGYTWHNENAINSFLASKKSSLRYNLEGGKIYGQGYIPSTKDSVAKMKEQVINYLKQNVNNSVELGLHRTEKIDILGKKKIIPLRFMTETGEVYRTTETWDEGDGHAVCVTGILDNYFVVSSWGKRLLIPIEDFIDNNFNVIFRKMEGIK